MSTTTSPNSTTEQSTPHLPTPFILLLLLISGALQPLTLAPYDLWFLGPLSIAVMLWAMQGLEPKSQQPVSASKSFVYGWFVGFGLLGSGASWVYISIHNFGNASPLLAGSLTFGFTGGIAILTGLAFWIYFKLKNDSRLHNALIFLALWVLGDEVRTEFLTGFPWLFLGYGHLESPLSGWMPIIGVYGVTCITVATGIIALLLISNISTRMKASLFAVTAAIWLIGIPLDSIS